MVEMYSADGVTVYHLEKMTFVELMKYIEHRQNFLPERTIWCLEAFINGWLVGKNDAGKVMQDFQKYLPTRYSDNANYGWSTTINLYSEDSFDALTNFFNEFNAFLKQRESNS